MRTAQDLLAERRTTVLELARERDSIARQMLQFSIDQIDRELHERSAQAPLNPPTRPCRICGNSPCDPADHVFADAGGPSAPRTYDEVMAAARARIAEFERSAS